MSTYGDLLEILTVKRSELVGKLGALVAVYYETPPRDPADDSTVKVDEIAEPPEQWGTYGFVSRPPAKAESLVMRAGATVAAIASRLLGAEEFYGKLGIGDSGMYSVGGNTIRLAASGAISMLVPSKGKQIAFRIDPKGKFQVMLGNGFMMELSEENGFTVTTPGKDITLAAGEGAVNVVASALNNDSAVFKANKAAAVPLATGPITKPNPGLFI